MNRPAIFIILFLLFPVAAGFAQPHTTDIRIQDGERWWGVFTDGSVRQPFTEGFSVYTDGKDGPRPTMLLSSAGRYLWSDHPAKIVFEQRAITINSDYERVEVQKGGKTLREAYLICRHKNFPPEGIMPADNLFTRPIYETYYDLGFAPSAGELLDFARKILDEGFPAGTLRISEGWTDMASPDQVDRSLFPDPALLLDQLHGLGFTLLATVSPTLPAYGRNYIDQLAAGNLILGGDDMPLVSNGKGGYSALYDLAQPTVAQRYGARLERLFAEFKPDGYILDLSEVIDGVARMEPAFEGSLKCLIESHSWTEVVGMPGGDGILSGFATDESNMREIPGHILSASLTGCIFSRPSFTFVDRSLLDDPDFLSAVIQLGALLPVMTVPVAPWRITDPERYAAVKKILLWRADRSRDMGDIAGEAARTAEPLVRNLEYQFPKNGFADCYDQYMLGPRILVIPYNPGDKKRIIRIPRGTWTDISGRRIKGPLVTEEDFSDGISRVFILSGK